MTETMLAHGLLDGHVQEVVNTGTMTMPPPRPLMEPMIPPAKGGGGIRWSQRMDWGLLGVISEQMTHKDQAHQIPITPALVICFLCGIGFHHSEFSVECFRGCL